MKILRLYDLRTGEVTEIPYTRQPKTACAELMVKSKPGKGFRVPRRYKRKLKNMAQELMRVIVSFSVGFIFWIALSGIMESVRGYDAAGGEIFVAGIVSFIIYSILEKVGEMKS